MDVMYAYNEGEFFNAIWLCELHTLNTFPETNGELLGGSGIEEN